MAITTRCSVLASPANVRLVWSASQAHSKFDCRFSCVGQRWYSAACGVRHGLVRVGFTRTPDSGGSISAVICFTYTVSQVCLWAWAAGCKSGRISAAFQLTVGLGRFSIQPHFSCERPHTSAGCDSQSQLWPRSMQARTGKGMPVCMLQTSAVTIEQRCYVEGGIEAMGIETVGVNRERSYSVSPSTSLVSVKFSWTAQLAFCKAARCVIAYRPDFWFLSGGIEAVGGNRGRSYSGSPSGCLTSWKFSWIAEMAFCKADWCVIASRPHFLSLLEKYRRRANLQYKMDAFPRTLAVNTILYSTYCPPILIHL